MKNTTVIAVIKTLDKKERREFAKWLASPFFNQRQDVQQMFHYLVSGKHLEDDKFLDKERIYKKIFPKEPYDDDKIRQTIHFLYKQLEQYLSYTEIKADPYAHSVAFAKAARKRKLLGVFQKKLNALRKEGLDQHKLDSTGLRHTYSLLYENSFLLLGVTRTKDIQLQQSLQAFDVSFIAEKIKFACEAQTHQRVYKTHYEQGFLDAVLDKIDQSPDLLAYPSIAIYYYGYLMQQQGDDSEEYYFLLKEQIAENIDIFRHAEQRAIYLMALNFCIQRSNKGAKHFWREIFEIYRDLIESKLLLEQGRLSSATYLNATRIALRLKEYAWINHLIQDYTEFLSPADQIPISSYCKARLAFEKENYDEAMSLLVHFDSRDVLIYLNARATLMKIYYMQDELDALDSLLGSMDAYLKRKKAISAVHKSNYQNIVRLIRKLTRINPFDKAKRQKLRTEIEETTQLTEKPWLLEQLDKMG